jgi:hypothetical protein
MTATTTKSFEVLSLGKDPSRRLRTLLRNACAFAGIATEQLKAVGAFPQDAPRSTIARYLSDEVDQQFSPRFASPCVDWLANFMSCSSAEITHFLASGEATSVALCELACRHIYSHTAAQMSEFDEMLRHAEGKATRCWMLRDLPPAIFLPESVMQRVYRWMTRLSTQPFSDFRIELDHGRASRRRFQRQGGHRFAEFSIILTRTCLEQLIGTSHASLLDQDERDLFIETILDRMEIHGVRVGLLDDRAGRPGAWTRPFTSRFDAVIGFDRSVLVRRSTKDAHRLVYDASGSPAQADIVQSDVELFAAAERHADFDQESVAEWLLERASDDSWRKLKRRQAGQF